MTACHDGGELGVDRRDDGLDHARAPPPNPLLQPCGSAGFLDLVLVEQ